MVESCEARGVDQLDQARRLGLGMRSRSVQSGARGRSWPLFCADGNRSGAHALARSVASWLVWVMDQWVHHPR
jgi:hypothetical protein